MMVHYGGNSVEVNGDMEPGHDDFLPQGDGFVAESSNILDELAPSMHIFIAKTVWKVFMKLSPFSTLPLFVIVTTVFSFAKTNLRV